MQSSRRLSTLKFTYTLRNSAVVVTAAFMGIIIFETVFDNLTVILRFGCEYYIMSLRTVAYQSDARFESSHMRCIQDVFVVKCFFFPFPNRTVYGFLQSVTFKNIFTRKFFFSYCTRTRISHSRHVIPVHMTLTPRAKQVYYACAGVCENLASLYYPLHIFLHTYKCPTYLTFQNCFFFFFCHKFEGNKS